MQNIKNLIKLSDTFKIKLELRKCLDIHTFKELTSTSLMFMLNTLSLIFLTFHHKSLLG